MVLETQTPTTKETPPENINSTRQIPEGTSEEESYRKGKTTNVPISALYSPQERLRQMETNSRPLNYQQVHKLPIIQDAVPQRSKTITPSRLLDDINRHNRWLLTRPNLSKQETLPRFPLQGHRLAVPSNAFWSKHRSKNFHQVDVTCRSGDGTGRHMVPTISGRSSHCCSYKGEVPSSYSNSLTDSQQARLHRQREEIALNSSTNLPLAWDRVGPGITHTARVSQDKISNLRTSLDTIFRSQTCTKRAIMQVQGLVNYIGRCDPVICLMMAVTRTILRRFKQKSPDAIIRIPVHLKFRICEWYNPQTIPQHLGSPAPMLIIQTDASLRGWGFQVGQQRFHGRFDKSVKLSINTLELLTIWFALITVHTKGLVIQILCDNTAAIAALRRGSSSHFRLSSLAELIWR